MKNKGIFLIAPSGNIDKKSLEISKKRSKKLGFSLINYRKDILSNHFDYAGDYKRRSKEINEAYDSINYSIIVSVKGGMGALQILPYLNYRKIKKSNKILIGSSDITILLNAINKKTGSRCLHGPNLGNKDKFDNKTYNSLLDAINKKDYAISIKKKNILVKGTAKGSIVGGNLELVGRSLGTSFEIDTQNKILFLEDYEMKSWRVYDILWQLKLSGKFEKVRAVILGYFTECGKNIDSYLNDFFKDFKCPVIMHQPFGHEQPNITFPIGEKCILDTEKGFWKVKF